MQTSDNSETTKDNDGKITVEKLSIAVKNESIHSSLQSTTPANKKEEPVSKKNTNPVSAASGGYLARPSNIYAETQAEVFTSTPSAEEPVSQKQPTHSGEESLCDMQM